MKEYAVRHPHNELCTAAINYTPPHSSLLPSLPSSSSCSLSSSLLLLPLLPPFPSLPPSPPPSSFLPLSLLPFLLPLPYFSITLHRPPSLLPLLPCIAPLLTFLGSTSFEIVYVCLQHIQLLLARQPQLWSKDYQVFFGRLAPVTSWHLNVNL